MIHLKAPEGHSLVLTAVETTQNNSQPIKNDSILIKSKNNFENRTIYFSSNYSRSISEENRDNLPLKKSSIDYGGSLSSSPNLTLSEFIRKKRSTNRKIKYQIKKAKAAHSDKTKVNNHNRQYTNKNLKNVSEKIENGSQSNEIISTENDSQNCQGNYLQISSNLGTWTRCGQSLGK